MAQGKTQVVTPPSHLVQGTPNKGSEEPRSLRSRIVEAAAVLGITSDELQRALSQGQIGSLGRRGCYDSSYEADERSSSEKYEHSVDDFDIISSSSFSGSNYGSVSLKGAGFRSRDKSAVSLSPDLSETNDDDIEVSASDTDLELESEDCNKKQPKVEDVLDKKSGQPGFTNESTTATSVPTESDDTFSEDLSLAKDRKMQNWFASGSSSGHGQTNATQFGRGHDPSVADASHPGSSSEGISEADLRAGDGNSSSFAVNHHMHLAASAGPQPAERYPPPRPLYPSAPNGIPLLPANSLDSHWEIIRPNPSSHYCSAESASEVVNLGPCSHTWKVPPPRRRTRRRGPGKELVNGHSSPIHQSQSQPRLRKAFTEQAKQITAQTRQDHACLRCHFQKIRCVPSDLGPGAPCKKCEALKTNLSKRLPCMRCPITDASLYRDQERPFQKFSKRWQTMEIIDIDVSDWASDSIRIIEVAQIPVDYPYTLELREYIPRDGDMTEEVWTGADGTIRTHKLPPFAIADMHKTAKLLYDFAGKSVGVYISKLVNPDLLSSTYFRAFKHCGDAETPEEKKLLVDVLRLWVACRLISYPERICGGDKLGVELVTDDASIWYQNVPIPPLIVAQMECIVYTKLLRPLSKAVLSRLEDLIMRNEKKYWYSIYLTLFVLLHSVSMITRRDWEYARQLSYPGDFLNQASIHLHHGGANTMLAHFHYINKGSQPFLKARTPSGVMELAASAGLNMDQAEFILQTAIDVDQYKSELRALRKPRADRSDQDNAARFGHDFYWISQLYDEHWRPGPTA